MLYLCLLFLFISLLGGFYPAFVLSKFRPIYVLKGSFRTSQKGVFLRKFITVIQFSIAAALILATIVIYRQMKFVQNKDLGYNETGIHWSDNQQKIKLQMLENDRVKRSCDFLYLKSNRSFKKQMDSTYNIMQPDKWANY